MLSGDRPKGEPTERERRRRRVAIAVALSMAVAVGSASAVDAASPAGLWRIVDDRTGKPQGFMRIYEENGRFFGRLERTMNPRDQSRACSACTDERKDQPLIGLVLMRNLRFDDGEYTGGDILDPDTGSVYRCKIRLEGDGTRLVVRGYIGVSLLGRSQTWIREQ